jgi:hypothetical protein
MESFAPLSDVFVTGANNSSDNPTNASSAPAAAAEPSPVVQPMHQSNINPLEMQRQILQKKLAGKLVATSSSIYPPKLIVIVCRNEYTSPTDQMMTPCSKKLQDYKKKSYTKYASC